MSFLFVILATLLWSIDTLIRYPLLGSIRPDTMVLIEHLFLVLFFVPVLVFKKFSFKKLDRSSLASFAVIGVVGSAAATLAFTKAFSLINPSLVILLQKLQPLVAISLSSIFLKEKIHRNFIAFGAAAFIGAFLISYNDIAPFFSAVSDGGELDGKALGYALTLFAVIGWGASTVFGKKLDLTKFTESEIMAGRFIFGFLFLMIFCSTQGALPSPALETTIYLKILLMVSLSGLLGMYLYYRGMTRLSAHVVSIAELFFPLSAVFINWIFLGKTLMPMQIIGAVVLVAASWKLQNLKD